MDRIAEWLRGEFQVQTLSYEEKLAHGLVFRGVSRGGEVVFLVPESQHVWMRKAVRQEWKPTGIKVPDRVMR
ncbi:hypothetical protein FE782_28595 [Paenibacillus antri]|uniref:Uncharacterized protein n=1 Tax=Paenibacillus antri TaxID=2582848 RepID=A0A5R9G3U7_9BACL|nr:hypothetical protein [Paenibacillus antri]TLS48820.1 hypothetical protein FE782_28595 [Paenibacillus antri]